MNCSIFDDALVGDKLEQLCAEDEDVVLDFHSGDFSPADMIELVVVLRADTSILF